MDTQSNIDQFCKATGQTQQVARSFLNKCESLEAAINAFHADSQRVFSKTTPASSSVRSQHGVQRATNSPRIATLGDMKESQEDPPDSNSYFAGGHQSGVAVSGGPKDRSEMIRKLLATAQEHGMTFDEYMSSQNGEAEDSKFSGHGYTLECNQSTSEVDRNPVDESKAAENEKTPRKIKLTLWSNGISIDDGTDTPTLRDLDVADPFVRAIFSRQTPKEISEKYGHDIDLEIIENRTESFHVKPRPFGGHGRRLGNPTEEGQVQSAAGTFARSNISHEESNSSASGDEAMKPYINPSLPTTKLQIRLANGRRLVVEFNRTATINDLMAYITGAGFGDRPYKLMSSFPRKELTEINQTLEEAGLCNAMTTMQAHMYMSPQSGSFEFMHRYLKLINHYEKQLNTQVDWIHTAIIDQQTTGRGGSASVPPHNPTDCTSRNDQLVEEKSAEMMSLHAKLAACMYTSLSQRWLCVCLLLASSSIYTHSEYLLQTTSDADITKEWAPQSQTCRATFFVIGARKGGTTSLYYYLTAHPNILPYAIKREITGESSVSSLVAFSAPKNARYLMRIRLGRHIKPHKPFRDWALKEKYEGEVNNFGCVVTLEMRKFTRRNRTVYKLGIYLADAYRFLGLDSSLVNCTEVVQNRLNTAEQNYRVQFNMSEIHNIDKHTETHLKEFFEPYNRDLETLLGVKLPAFWFPSKENEARLSTTTRQR
eukprot:gene2587-5503_t